MTAFWFRRSPFALALALSLGLEACHPFEFSPYDTRHGTGRTDLSAFHIGRLAAAPPEDGPFAFAVLADVQGAYDELDAAVRRINADTSIRLVILAGDLTQSGMRQEFEWLEGVMSRLNPPYLTVLGNHDALANGVDVYRNMFGPLDFSFVHRGTAFVFYNDNALHFRCCAPDLAWIEGRFREAGDSLAIVAVSHVPPYGDQLDSATSGALAGLLAKYRVRLSIHGHNHHYHHGHLQGDGVDYLIVDNVADRNYAKVTLRQDAAEVERIFY